MRFKHCISALACIAVLLLAVPKAFFMPADAAGEYTGETVRVGSVTLPLAEHMPGTYFTKNGSPCTCHGSGNCIASIGGCNCMRYYPTGVKETCEVDLYAAQCYAFARLVFWRCFGFIDHSMNASLYYNVGSITRGNVTAASVKTLLTKAAPGAHVRLSAGHSVSILSMDDDHITIYHANAGGDGVAQSSCVVSTKRYTWEQFAAYAARGIEFVNMPYNYPGSESYPAVREPGVYRLSEGMNLRAEANTASDVLAVIPSGTYVCGRAVDGLWGSVEYGGSKGYIFLEYSSFVTLTEIAVPDIFSFENGVVFACGGYTSEAFSAMFEMQSLTLRGTSGGILDPQERVGTGASAEITVGGVTYDKALICIRGDVNGNGVLDVGDFVVIRRAVLGTASLSGVYALAADADKNGRLDAADYLLLRRVFLGTADMP